MTEKENKKAKRLTEFNSWIASFISSLPQAHSSKIKFIENASGILNDAYWAMIDSYVRPLVDDSSEHEQGDDSEANISRYKIISATELVIVAVQPIVHQQPEKERQINALFAYYVAITILQAFNPAIKQETISFVDHYKEDIPDVKKEDIQTIHEDHITWLSILDTDTQIPILSNAQTWRLLNLGLLALERKVPYDNNP